MHAFNARPCVRRVLNATKGIYINARIIMKTIKEVKMMKLDEMQGLLSQEYEVLDIKEIQHGHKFILQNGAIVNVFNTGKYNVQGKESETVKAYIESNIGDQQKAGVQTTSISKKVFVVYGHDEAARNELELILRRWELEPIILDRMPSGGQTIIEKLETYSKDVKYGVVLATPDDEGHRREFPDEKMCRCRQNVVLEMGMLLAKLGRENVAILQKNPSITERPSDIQGLVYIPFENKISEVSQLLAREIEPKLNITIPASKL